MGYYARGDYYRGDPFIGALIGGAAKSLGLGKVVSKAARWVGSRISPSSVKKATAVLGTTAVAAPVLTMGGGMLPARTTNVPAPINIGPLGINPSAALPGGEPLFSWGTKKRRRMNPLNPKALKRAVRRAEGFEKFAKATVNALYKTSSCGCSKRTKRFKKS